MAFNLYPYNYWCLYGALIALVIFLIYLGVKAKPLMSYAKELKPTGEKIKQNVDQSKEKADYIKTVIDENKDTSVSMFKSYILLRAITKNYKQSSDKGVKTFNKAAVNAFTRHGDEKALFSFVKNLFQ